MGERLGQHFLTSDQVVENMVTAAAVRSRDRVLEIGPGTGILTKQLLKKGARTIAVEKDTELVKTLEKKFVSEIEDGQLTLMNADIRDVSFETLFKQKPYKVVANIPYYITGEIIRLLLESSQQPTSITLLLQKEVAQRIVAKGKESLLSISVKVYGDPKYIKTVSKDVFSPPPQVDSAILHIEDISRAFFKEDSIDEKSFFQLVRAGFSHKRKTLANNLSQKGWDKDNVEQVLTEAGLDVKIRAEKLSLSEWKEVFKVTPHHIFQQ